MNLRTLPLGTLLIIVAQAAHAQAILGPNGPEAKEGARPRRPAPNVFELKVSPAPEPTPALKHRLVIDPFDQTPGNGAPYYYRAVLAYQQAFPPGNNFEIWDYEKWMELPPAELPREETAQVLNRFSTAYGQLRIAASRETCDWEWRIRDVRGMDTVSFLLTEIQECRRLARLLALKARVEIADGRYDEAIETLRIGYKLARDVAQPPTIINALVGCAIDNIMDTQLIQLIGAPGSPNLYWAIAELPTPFVDMRPALEQEKLLPVRIFPFLKDAETAQRTPEEWRGLLRDAYEEMGELSNPSTGIAALNEFLFISAMLQGYTNAKSDLLKQGFSAEQLDAMPVAQVVAIQQALAYRHVFDEMFKWTLVPYREAIAGMKRTEERLHKEGYSRRQGSTRETLPITGTLIPSVVNATLAGARPDLRHAGLQVVEAIRMHAAQNGGRLPQSLDEISVVPVPKNDLTGESFAYFYRIEDGTASLALQDPLGSIAGTWQIELTEISIFQ